MTQKGQKKRTWGQWIGGKVNSAGRWIKAHWKPIAGAAAAAAAAGAAVYLGTKDNSSHPPPAHHAPAAPPAAPPAAAEPPPPRSAQCSNAVINRFRDAACGGRRSEMGLLRSCHPDKGGTAEDWLVAQRVGAAKARRCGYTTRFTN